MNIIISNKNHLKSISLFLCRVGASVARNQDNLNLLLCLHLNTSALRSLSRCRRSLKLIILIFSSIHKLYLPLKLFADENCLTISHLIWEVSRWSFRFQKYLDRVVLVSKPRIGEGMSEIKQSFFPNSLRRYLHKNPLPSFLCSMWEMHVCYTTFFELHRPPKGHSSFHPQLQDTPTIPIEFV